MGRATRLCRMNHLVGGECIEGSRSQDERPFRTFGGNRSVSRKRRILKCVLRCYSLRCSP